MEPYDEKWRHGVEVREEEMMETLASRMRGISFAVLCFLT